ncbi:NAD(P)/FAD-dependent oxidoreductase [Leifsonia aquatica]|uniref:NAD(P)/FAD-dependent oxidoreductase n=1 Tax=Leifsonia aquatica TaxID=144185 RepID=UPI0038512FDD
MKILLTVDNPDVLASDFLELGVIRKVPRSLEESPRLLLEAIVEHHASAMIAYRRPSEDLLSDWQHAVGQPIHVAYVVGAENATHSTQIGTSRIPDTSIESIALALQNIERDHARKTTPQPSEPVAPRKRAVLIGAGIVNLVTALHLETEGFDVHVLEASPEPGGDWHDYGCTHAGDDARMFTFTEMDGYGNQSFTGSSSDVFRKPVLSGGWNALARPLRQSERDWMTEFERIPSWLARTYTDDVLALNAEAYLLWLELFEKIPAIFEGSVLRHDILRLYSDANQLNAARQRHVRIGALTQELDEIELARQYPALKPPIAHGLIAGGLLVPGFTVNIHKFANHLVSYLRERGVRFSWNSPVRTVKRDDEGTVTTFDSSVPIDQTAHVVASPGTDRFHLLDGSACEGKIHGVIGGWMRIANKASLNTSLKLARKGHRTEDANITVATDLTGEETLIVGSGYGYVGEGPTVPDSVQLDAMRTGIEDTVRNYFPDAPYRARPETGDDYGFKYCVRPWTSTSLGIFHSETMSNGGIYVITGGHNTGGFAQAPAIAAAVAARLSGREHPMHWMYHPDRFTNLAPSPFSEQDRAHAIGVLL